MGEEGLQESQAAAQQRPTNFSNNHLKKKTLFSSSFACKLPLPWEAMSSLAACEKGIGTTYRLMVQLVHVMRDVRCCNSPSVSQMLCGAICDISSDRGSA